MTGQRPILGSWCRQSLAAGLLCSPTGAGSPPLDLEREYCPRSVTTCDTVKVDDKDGAKVFRGRRQFLLVSLFVSVNVELSSFVPKAGER